MAKVLCIDSFLCWRTLKDSRPREEPEEKRKEGRLKMPTYLKPGMIGGQGPKKGGPSKGRLVLIACSNILYIPLDIECRF